MTTLAITPNWKNKSAKFKGTVAAGEHVSVTIQNENGEGGEFIEDVSALRLRVVDPCNGRTLAIFPEPVPEGETPEEWDSDLSPLRCTLNLNTVQMLRAVLPAANVPLLWVLDDYDNKTLYFKEQFHVEHWPRLRGEEEPTDLDNYKDLIADFNTRLDGYDSRITGAENAAQAATENASAALEQAASAAAIANNAVAIAQDAKSGASDSAAVAVAASERAASAAEAAESAAESINSPDATLTEEGVAADAKATGDAIADEETRATAAEAAEETRAKGVESGLRTDLTAAQKAIDDEAVLRAAADADLEARKADKTAVATAIQAETSRAQAAEQGLRADVSSAQTAIDDRYTKSEVDAKIAGVQTFGKVVVQTLPDLADADDKTIYLVPRADSEAPDLCDEYVVVEDDGVRRWERIGAKAVDLTLDDAVTRASANGVKSSGIWSAIWGALAALPTGVASLYDWCVAQFAGKLNSTSAAPAWVSGTTYAANALVTYNGKIYCNKFGGTFTSDIPPSADTNWEANPVSDLFLPLTGGTLTGSLTASMFEVPNGAAGGLRLHYADYNATIYYHGATGVYIGVKQGTSGTYYIYFQDRGGTLAFAAPNPTAGHLAALDANGNPTDSGWTAGDLARYALVTPTISNGAATLADRACNAITAAATLTIPAAVPGRLRDIIVDVDNSAGASDIGLELASDAAAYLDAGGARYLVAVADGDDLADLLTVAAGARARLYFTETAQTATPTGGTFAVPVISLQRLTVTVGGES